jgi:hypothetical protein
MLITFVIFVNKLNFRLVGVISLLKPAPAVSVALHALAPCATDFQSYLV